MQKLKPKGDRQTRRQPRLKILPRVSVRGW